MIIKADKDGDNRVSEDEAQQFIRHLKLFAGVRGKKFDEHAMRAAFKNSMRTSSAFDLVASSMSQEKPTDEEVDGGFVTV